MVMKKGFTKKGIGIIILSAIEIFLFSGYCRNLQGIFIGILIHLLLLLTISLMISERKTYILLYYAEVLLNYLLVFPVYNNWHSGIDHYLIFIYQIILSRFFSKLISRIISTRVISCITSR